MTVTSQELLTDNLFTALAKRVWHVYVKEPKDFQTEPPELPTREVLAKSIVDGELDQAFAEYDRRIAAIHEVRQLQTDAQLVKLQIGTLDYFVARELFNKELDELSDEQKSVMKDLHRKIVAGGLDAAHEIWVDARESSSDLKHPLSPLIEGWFKRPKSLVLTLERIGIVPTPFKGSRYVGYLPTPPSERQELGLVSGSEPLFFPAPTSTFIPTSIIETWTSTGDGERKGDGGAPLDLRLAMEILSDVPPEHRRAAEPFRIDMTLGNLVDRLYYRQEGQRSSFNPKRHTPAILAALQALDYYRIPIVLPGYEKSTKWRAFNVVGEPSADLGSPVVIFLILPPGSAGGAAINRVALRNYGAKSAPKYRAALGFAYLWDTYGTHPFSGRPIQATRPRVARNVEGHPVGIDGQVLLTGKGKPVGSAFNDPRLLFLNDAGRCVVGQTLPESRRLAARERNPSVDKYPVLAPYDLLVAFYPQKAHALQGADRRLHLHRSRKYLHQMADDRYCVIETATDAVGEPGYRVLPTEWNSFVVS